MNWEAIGAIGAIVGATAVVVSIVYLAYQIKLEAKENKKSHQLATLSNIAGRFTAFRNNVIHSPELTLVWMRGQDDLNNLDSLQRYQFDYLAVEMFWCWGMLYLYKEQDAIDEFTLKLSMANLKTWGNSPGLQQWWSESGYKKEYHPKFIAHVDNLFSDESDGVI